MYIGVEAQQHRAANIHLRINLPYNGGGQLQTVACPLVPVAAQGIINFEFFPSRTSDSGCCVCSRMYVTKNRHMHIATT